VEVRLERGEKRREDGRGAVKDGGGARHFYRDQGSAGEGWPGFNACVNGFNAIEDGGWFKREIKGGGMKAGW
jgi:hypothetical protein